MYKSSQITIKKFQLFLTLCNGDVWIFKM